MNITVALTPEQKELGIAVGKYLDKEVAPRLEEFEENRQVDHAIWRKFGELGWLCPWADPKYGGSNASFMDSYVIANEIAVRGMSAVMTWLHSDVVAPYIDMYASTELQDRYMPSIVKGEKVLAVAMTEPESGSDLSAIRTTALKDGDDYIINGGKIYISCGYSADLIVVAAKTDPEAGPKGISLILVEANSPGITRFKLDKYCGQSQDTAEIIFDNVRVPQKNLIGKEGAGMIMLMTKLQQERLLAALASQGSAEYALELAVQQTKQRKMFGRSVADYQNTQFTLAGLAAKIQAGRVLVDNLAQTHSNANKKADILLQSSMAKLFCTELAYEVAGVSLQLHGGSGFMKPSPIGKLFMDTKISCVAAGTSEIMKLIIGRALFVDKK